MVSYFSFKGQTTRNIHTHISQRLKSGTVNEGSVGKVMRFGAIGVLSSNSRILNFEILCYWIYESRESHSYRLISIHVAVLIVAIIKDGYEMRFEEVDKS